MAIKDILVLLDASSEVAGSYVLSVTAACEAHLTGAVLVVDPATIVPFAEMPSGFLAAALDEQRTAARQILERFASVAEEAGIAVDTEIHRPRSTLAGKPLARSPATLISRSSSSPIRMSSPSGRARSKQRCSPRAGLCWLFPTSTRPRSNWSRFWWPGTEALRRPVHSGTPCPCWRRPKPFRL